MRGGTQNEGGGSSFTPTKRGTVLAMLRVGGGGGKGRKKFWDSLKMIGALVDGGSPMSHVDFKKWPCPLSLFL